MINTPGELRTYMEIIAAEHKQINDFYYGNYDEIMGADRSRMSFPLLWLEDMEVTPEGEDSFQLIFDFSFVILSNSPKDDKSRQLNNHELTFRIAMAILSRLKKDSEDDVIGFLLDNINIEPIYTFGNDNDQGWRATIKLVSDSLLCESADEWNDYFPAGTIPRFSFNPDLHDMIFTNTSTPAGESWTTQWRYKKNSEAFQTSFGDSLSVIGSFDQLYVEMSITKDGTHLLYASTYLTEQKLGFSVPFIYNPIK